MRKSLGFQAVFETHRGDIGCVQRQCGKKTFEYCVPIWSAIRVVTVG
jgi:hypothetical protein